MAKWYEASVSSGSSSDGLVQQAVQQARVLRDQLLLEGLEAIEQPGGEAWQRVGSQRSHRWADWRHRWRPLPHRGRPCG